MNTATGTVLEPFRFQTCDVNTALELLGFVPERLVLKCPASANIGKLLVLTFSISLVMWFHFRNVLIFGLTDSFANW